MITVKKSIRSPLQMYHCDSCERDINYDIDAYDIMMQNNGFPEYRVVSLCRSCAIELMNSMNKKLNT